MNDRETGSLWAQPSGEALLGELAETRLSVLPSTMATWRLWKETHPETTVISTKTGFKRDYLSNRITPNVDKRQPPGRPLSNLDTRLPPRELIIGIIIGKTAKAYPIGSLKGKSINDEIDGTHIEIVGAPSGRSASIYFRANGNKLLAPTSTMYWFAWSLAHTNTMIMRPESL